MLERRRFLRFKMRLPVGIRISDKENNTDITNTIDVFTENVSKSGLCLVLPRSWDCPECNNCLGWIYNLGCKLKNNHTKDEPQFLVSRHNLKISFSDASIPIKEPIQLEGSCVWVKTDIQGQDNNYYVGVHLPEASQKKISSMLSNALSP